MKEKKAVFRHELKYEISFSERDIQIARMKEFLRLDPNAGREGYLIRSLYFDDYWNSAYEEKLMGVAYRKKYRIRIYNYQDKMIKLECKNKQGNYIYKESASLSRLEVEKILMGDYQFLLTRAESLCQRFYVACVSDGMRPKVIVDYDRIPYIYEAGTVRITFDAHVRAGIGSFDLFDKDIPTIEVMPADKLIMEVKYTECLPRIVQNILPQESGKYVAASKYAMCYEEKMRLLV